MSDSLPGNYNGLSASDLQQAGFKHQILGQQGSPYQLLLLERMSRCPDAPTLYLSAGIHGDEPAGIHAIESMVRDNRFSTEVNWLIFPCLNPTGYLNNKRRNDRGIDLNRDYYYQKSEEIQAHAAWMKQECPNIDLYLSLHEDWEAKGSYLYEINTHPGQKGFANEILDVADKILPLDPSPIIDAHPVNARGLIRHRPEPDEIEGWPEAIFACKHKPLLSYTFETPSTFPLEQRVAAHIAVIEFCARRYH